MQCPKCNYFPTYVEALGNCQNCGRSDWTLGRAHRGDRIVICPHCEVGPEEIACPKCESSIMGTWLEKEKKTGCLTKLFKLFIAFIIITIILMVLAGLSRDEEESDQSQTEVQSVEEIVQE